MHHVRKLADLDTARTDASRHGRRLMANRRRKTLVVCAACHDRIHDRAASRTAHAVVTGEPDDRETGKSGSAGGRAEKDPHQRAPRRAADPALDCLKPSLQKVQEPHLPERRPKPVTGPCGRVTTNLPQSSGVLERCPIRVLKETNGTPKSR